MVKFGKKLLYRDWIVEWLNEKRNYVKESTYANYSSIVYNHLIPQLGKYKLNSIDYKMLQQLIIDKYQIGRLDNTGGLSDKTVRDIGTVIKLSMKSAMRDNLINYINLDFYYPKSNNVHKIHIFSKTEQRRIIDYCMSNLNIKTACILLALYSGIRIGELCALKWEDIDFKRNILYVNKTIQRIYIKQLRESKVIITTPKTKNAIREIPLNKDFALLLKRFKTSNNNYILSNSSKWMEPRSFREFYYVAVREMGIRDITFHSLRHTFASNCIRLGVDYKTVSELLGHASVNITLNIYVHPQLSQKKKCINLLYRDNNEINNYHSELINDDNSEFMDYQTYF